MIILIANKKKIIWRELNLLTKRVTFARLFNNTFIKTINLPIGNYLLERNNNRVRLYCLAYLSVNDNFNRCSCKNTNNRCMVRLPQCNLRDSTKTLKFHWISYCDPFNGGSPGLKLSCGYLIAPSIRS